MDLKLRDYQTEIIQKTYQAMASGSKRPLVVLPTGGGKTVCFAWMANAAQQKKSVVWFLVHRRELYEQTEATFERFGIPTDEIYIGMVGQVARNASLFPRPDLIIFDECFPAGTLVDGKPIESYKIGDVVQSLNHKSGEVEKKKVVHVFKNREPEVMVRINKHLLCTPDHPIFIKERRAYVKAIDIKAGESVLSLVSERNLMEGSSKVSERSVVEESKNLLLKRVREKLFKKNIERNDVCNQQKVCLEANDRKQSNERSGHERKDASDLNIKRSQAEKARRKWSRNDCSSGDFNVEPERAKSRAGIHYQNAHAETKRDENTHSLQAGYCVAGRDDCDRSGRGKSFFTRTTKSRQEKRKVLKWERVESVEILQRGCHDEFDGLRSDGYVYNLEVEGNNNYFANGTLVHNCHHSTATTWKKITEQFPDAWIIGLTATPCRLDGKPLGEVYDSLVQGVTTADLIRSGYLSDYRAYSVSTTDLSALKRKGKDFDMDEAADLMMDRAVYGDVIKHYQELANGKRAICFCTTVRHSEAMADIFRQAGITAEHFDGNTPKRKRTEIVERFRSGETQILCNVDIVSEGFDLAACDAVILLRPTQSLSLYLQQVGRALRPAPDKTAIILDHVGNALRHGLPDDHRDWSLASQVRSPEKFDEEGKLILRTCSVCFGVYPNTVSECPLCGATYQTTREEIEQINEVRLIELKRKQEQRYEAWQERKAESLESESDCKTYAELIALGKKKGVPNLKKYATKWSYQLGISRPWDRRR